MMKKVFIAFICLGVILSNSIAHGLSWPVDFTTFTLYDPYWHISTLSSNEVLFDGTGRIGESVVPDWHLVNANLLVPEEAVELNFDVNIVGDANTFLVYIYDMNPEPWIWGFRGSMSRVGEVLPDKVVFDLTNPMYNKESVDLIGEEVWIGIRYITNDSQFNTNTITISNMMFQDFHSTPPPPDLTTLSA